MQNDLANTIRHNCVNVIFVYVYVHNNVRIKEKNVTVTLDVQLMQLITCRKRVVIVWYMRSYCCMIFTASIVRLSVNLAKPTLSRYSS